MIANRMFGKVHIDVGFSDARHGLPDHLKGEDLLAIAGIARAVVFAIPRVQQFAKKMPRHDRTPGRLRVRSNDHR